MTPREQALVDAYESQRHIVIGAGIKRPPSFGAGWFIKHHGSAKRALAAWRASAGRLAGVSKEAAAWIAEVESLIRQAGGEELS